VGPPLEEKDVAVLVDAGEVAGPVVVARERPLAEYVEDFL